MSGQLNLLLETQFPSFLSKPKFLKNLQMCLAGQLTKKHFIKNQLNFFGGTMIIIFTLSTHTAGQLLKQKFQDTEIQFPLLTHNSYLICTYYSFSCYFVKEGKFYCCLEIEQLFKSQRINKILSPISYIPFQTLKASYKLQSGMWQLFNRIHQYLSQSSEKLQQKRI